MRGRNVIRKMVVGRVTSGRRRKETRGIRGQVCEEGRIVEIICRCIMYYVCRV